MSGMASPLTRAADARDAATQAAALVRLRWVAVVAQLVVFAGVDHWLHIALPWRPLLAGVVVLALVNAGIQRAARHGRIAPLTPALAVDIGVLSWQLYWSGGPANPFVSLYLVPIALAAAWRRRARWWPPRCWRWSPTARCGSGMRRCRTCTASSTCTCSACG